MTDLQIRFEDAAYHRNGICGEGFWHIAFSFLDDRGNRVDARCVLFEDTGCCAVLTAGLGECWRGDNFEPEMRSFVASPAAARMAWPSQAENASA